MSEFSKRIVRPVVLPLVALAAIAFMVFFGSRILLAVPAFWSTSIALAISATILLYASVLSAVRSVTPAQSGLSLALGLAIVGAGGWALGTGIRDIEAHATGPTIVAQGIEWEQKEVAVEPGHVTLTMDNQDAGIPHNLSLYETDAFEKAIVIGEIVAGPASNQIEIEELAAGTYAYRCDVHPNMVGTLKVEEGAGGGGHGGGSSEGPAATPSSGDHGSDH